MADPAAVLGDLRAEGDALDGLVGRIAPERWAAPTPAPGWTIAHQIAHLAWTDECAVRSTEGAQAFQPLIDQALAAPDTFVDEAAARGAALPPAELLARWRAGRERVDRVLAGQPAGARLPWFGPPMSVASMATGRLMETWAHGQDIADTLGVTREPTARLRHVARIGARARDYAYAVRGLDPPAEEFRVELTAPGGELWSYGPPDAAQRVTGPALDFCLLVTQRAHRSEVAVTAEGPDADHWLNIAQAFAGPAGPGREPGSRGASGVGREAGIREPGGPGREPGSRGAGREPGSGRPGGAGREPGSGGAGRERGSREPGGPGREPGSGRPGPAGQEPGSGGSDGAGHESGSRQSGGPGREAASRVAGREPGSREPGGSGREPGSGRPGPAGEEPGSGGPDGPGREPASRGAGREPASRGAGREPASRGAGREPGSRESGGPRRETGGHGPGPAGQEPRGAGR